MYIFTENNYLKCSILISLAIISSLKATYVWSFSKIQIYNLQTEICIKLKQILLHNLRRFLYISLKAVTRWYITNFLHYYALSPPENLSYLCLLNCKKKSCVFVVVSLFNFLNRTSIVKSIVRENYYFNYCRNYKQATM